MDLRESIWDFTKVFSRRSACTTCRKTFLAQNFHGIQYIKSDSSMVLVRGISPIVTQIPARDIGAKLRKNFRTDFLVKFCDQNWRFLQFP